MHMDDAHCFTHVVEKRIKERVEGVKDVIVHFEPNNKISLY